MTITYDNIHDLVRQILKDQHPANLSSEGISVFCDQYEDVYDKILDHFLKKDKVAQKGAINAPIIVSPKSQ